jgi:hypothetical protein
MGFKKDKDLHGCYDLAIQGLQNAVCPRADKDSEIHNEALISRSDNPKLSLERKLCQH